MIPLKNSKLSKGLTLIELLVVVAILGILAAVLLAAVDPVQQQLKSTDAVAENTANEWVQSNYRFYGSKTAYPWYPTPGCMGATPIPGFNPGSGATPPVMGGATPIVLPTLMNGTGTLVCAGVLTSAGELKTSFMQIDPNILNKIYVNQPGTPGGAPTSLSACYLPQSKSAQAATNATYNSDGSTNVTPGACPGGASCYYCAF